jgi:CheY-like chemotaxis protein
MNAGAVPQKNVHKHVVQFYKDDNVLCAAVVPALHEALLERSAVVVIATAAHRRAFREGLVRLGVGESMLSQRLVMLDAQETLSKFMVGGKPDWDLFKQTVGEVIENASQRGALRLHAYGEMVNLLWQDGDVSQAVTLENFWNDLAQIYPFSLLCAYAFPDLGLKTGAMGVKEICGAHTHGMTLEAYDGETGGSVWVVEDDEDDFDCIKGVFDAHYPGIRLFNARNYKEFAVLAHRHDTPKPSVILLDLNLPGTDGRHILSELRENPQMDAVPVVVLTTSASKTDKNFVDCFKNSYFVTKPAGHAAFVAAVRGIVDRYYQLASRVL